MLSELIFIIFDIIILYLLIGIIKKMRTLKNQRSANDYIKDIVIGTVAGIVVLLLDKGMNIIFNNFSIMPAPNFQSMLQLFSSIVHGLPFLFFEIGILILLCLFKTEQLSNSYQTHSIYLENEFIKENIIFGWIFSSLIIIYIIL